jgi:hypothetical protein
MKARGGGDAKRGRIVSEDWWPPNWNCGDETVVIGLVPLARRPLARQALALALTLTLTLTFKRLAP